MNNEIYKTIRISDMRPDEHHLAIDTTDGTATEIAKVVVRMAGKSEDNPVLVEFANELVNRYNDYILPPPDAELVKASLRDQIAHLTKVISEVDAMIGDESLTKKFRLKEAMRILSANSKGMFHDH